MMGEGFGINPTEGEVVSQLLEKLIMFFQQNMQLV